MEEKKAIGRRKYLVHKYILVSAVSRMLGQHKYWQIIKIAHKFWKGHAQKYLKNLCQSLPRRMQAVIHAQGRHTKY